MPLATGTRLGPYEVQNPLGAGGMGEVYRARDTRLDRTVAIKILPAHLAEASESRERFDREAKTLSHLNHRHVCALYDVGQVAETAYLVMEFLEGETLSARLARQRRLPIADAIRIGTEIADALDAAHTLGITHRDLKPANVMLTKAGAKLLDFGLAKDGRGAGVLTMDAALPTRTNLTPGRDAPLTGAGTILGTVPYMAPEQIEGQPADARTDIFAFGALLYEMIAGRRAFDGKSSASVMGSILKESPPALSSINDIAMPASLEFLAQKCLAKDPDDRWQSARDIRNQLEWIATAGGSPSATTGIRSSDPRIAWAAAGAVALVSITAVLYVLSRPSSTASPVLADVRFNVDVPAMNSPTLVTISPDGKTIAFVGTKPNGADSVIWRRPLGAIVAEPLAETEGAFSPFWSPDSDAIGFAADGKVKHVNLQSGRVQVVCEVPEPLDFSGGTWNRDGTILFSAGSALFQVKATGGTPAAATTLDRARGERFHYFPSFLPDGRHFLFLINSSSPENAGVHIGSLDSQEGATVPRRPRVIAGATSAVYAEPGYLIYHDAGQLMALPFDATGLRATGPAVRLVNGVSHTAFGRMAVDVSTTGVLVYRQGEGEMNGQLTWFNRKGAALSVVGPPVSSQQLALSPDDKRAALQRRDPATATMDIWTIDLSSGVLTRITFDRGDDIDPTWSPDGQSLAFGSTQQNKPGIYVRHLAKSHDELMVETLTGYVMEWAPDGRILYHNRQVLFASPVSGSREPQRLFESRFSKDEGHVSRDGQWIAFNSDESSRVEVHVASYPAFDRRRQVSSGGGGSPRWRADGRELFYMSPDGKMMSVPVTPGPAPEFGAPVVLFQTAVATPALDMDQYGVTGDGQRFLILNRQSNPTLPITVMLDWTRLLK